MLLPTTPFQSKLGTNYSPSDTGIGTINEILLKVDTMSAQLEAQIEALRAKHAAVASFAASHRALLSPIRRVPLDVLTTIFLVCMESYKTCTMTPDQSPLLLTRVCHQWRELVVNTPSLWTSISIKIPHYPSPFTAIKFLYRAVNEQEEELLDVEDQVEADAVVEMAKGRWHRMMQRKTILLKLWLERGRDCPLYVSITFECQDPSALESNTLADLLSLLCKHASRWMHIGLCSGSHRSGIPSQLLSVPASRATKLVSLSMLLENYAVPPNSFANASDLRRLCLPWLGKAISDDFTFQWGNLTELSLLRETTQKGTPPSIALAVLKKCPALVQCEIKLVQEHRNSPPFTKTPCRVLLLHLRSLMVCERVGRSAALAFFESLDVPSIHSLALMPSGGGMADTRHQEVSLLPLLQKYGHNVRNLDLGRGQILSVAHLTQALKVTPNVEELTVDLDLIRWSSGASLVHLATHDGSTQQPRPIHHNVILRIFEVDGADERQPLCPNLRSLRFFQGSCEFIAAKAIARIVRSRQQEASGVTQLQSVIVRFQNSPSSWKQGSDTAGEKWSPPPRWQESKLNALALAERIIRVEWPNVGEKQIGIPAPARYDRLPFESWWDSQSNMLENCGLLTSRHLHVRLNPMHRNGIPPSEKHPLNGQEGVAGQEGGNDSAGMEPLLEVCLRTGVSKGRGFGGVIQRARLENARCKASGLLCSPNRKNSGSKQTEILTDVGSSSADSKATQPRTSGIHQAELLKVGQGNSFDDVDVIGILDKPDKKWGANGASSSRSDIRDVGPQCRVTEDQGPPVPADLQEDRAGSDLIGWFIAGDVLQEDPLHNLDGHMKDLWRDEVQARLCGFRPKRRLLSFTSESEVAPVGVRERGGIKLNTSTKQGESGIEPEALCKGRRKVAGKKTKEVSQQKVA
ncbi:hypothetical protein BKA70DRAFT_1401519 [Coprinopsis sp. MPI-PUGE-AT-0042]|nr:hypothetical protein BKA70DRAFT_1401519 [Coprinopsis sp. MPI-PUGE-AT-0042]